MGLGEQTNDLAAGAGVLSDASVDQFLGQADQLTQQTLLRMAKVENWTVDGGAAQKDPQRIESLVLALESKLSELMDAGVAPPHDVVLQLVAYVKSPRFAVLLRWMEERLPGYTLQLGELASQKVEAETASLFIDRLTHLERTHTLWRVFNPDRLADILELMDGFVAPELQ